MTPSETRKYPHAANHRAEESPMDNKAPPINLLKLLVPFADLSAAHLAEIAKKVIVQSVPAGKVLFRLGSTTPYCFYLLEGSIELTDAADNKTLLQNGSEATLHPLDNTTPHQLTAVTRDAIRILAIDRNQLDLVLTWCQAGLIDAHEDDRDWMDCLLESSLFTQIPPANLQQLFVRFQSAPAKAGDVIIHEGDPGDFFYVIKSGSAVVTRDEGKHGKQTLATLGKGRFFGEDALISDGIRNATITMVRDGELMKLSKDDFRKILHEPVLRYISQSELNTLKNDDERMVWVLDVRTPAEFKHDHLDDSINVPLNQLRQRITEFGQDDMFITYCDGGRRSELAAHLLSQVGISARVLRRPAAS